MSIFIQSLMQVMPKETGTKCRACGWVKPDDQFYWFVRTKTRKDGTQHKFTVQRKVCKECYKRIVNFKRSLQKCAKNVKD